jgi:hypothetical protein
MLGSKNPLLSSELMAGSSSLRAEDFLSANSAHFVRIKLGNQER